MFIVLRHVRRQTTSSELHLVPDALNIDPLQGSVGGEEVTVVFSRVEREVWLRPQPGGRQLHIILLFLRPLEAGELPEAEAPGLVIIRSKDQRSAPGCESLEGSRTGHSLGQLQSVGVDLSAGQDLASPLQAQQVVHIVSQLHLGFQGSAIREGELGGDQDLHLLG